MAGFKTFVDLDILTAADVNDFLMTQAVMTFADEAARTAALPTPTEGMVTYLADTDLLEVFTGAGFVVVNDNTAAILKAIIDAKGDLIVGTGADTPARFAAGTNEHRLVADSGETAGLKYVADTTNFAVSSKGDLLAGTAADTVAALAVGTNDHVLTADSGEATGMKWAAVAAGGGGKVLQVVSATTSTATTIAGVTFADSTLTATITPTLATSKVLVLVSQPTRVSRTSLAFAFMSYRLLRNSTTVYEPGGTGNIAMGFQFGGSNPAIMYVMLPIAFLDSPATTSAITYKTQGRGFDAASTVVFHENSSVASIVLLEIGV